MYVRRASTNSNNPGPSTPTQSVHEVAEPQSPPNISRYGRSHKPKMQDDYVSTDKKVSAYLKLSPGNQMQYFSAQKEHKKKSSPKKSDDGTPRRGRPPKSPGKSASGIDSAKLVVKTEPQDPSSPVDGCEWMVGDLAWARVGGHPFWPCVIALDPVQKIFTKTVRKGRTVVSQRWVHVQFFGDNGRRSWLNTTNIISYNGRDAFIQLGDTILAGMRRKDPKQTAAFVIKPAVVQVWEKAVQEAEDLVNVSREERIDFFTTHFPPAPPPQFTREDLIQQVLDQPVSPPKKRGRKRKADLSPLEEESKKKQMKLEEEKVSESVDPLLSSTPRTIADRKKRQALLMQLARTNQQAPAAPTDPAPFSSQADESVSTPPKETPLKRPAPTETAVSVEKKKPKKKYVKKKISADFQAFSSKNFDRVFDDHPELSEKEINRYLHKAWNEMDESQKARYRSRLTGQEKEESESAEETSDDIEVSSEDVEEDVRSSKSSSPAPLAVSVQKTASTKRNNCKYLFSGAKAEKVCQICEKTGDTVRCRGPCQGYYHPDCLTNPPPVAQQVDSSITPGKKGKRGRPKKSLENSPSSSESSTSQVDVKVENERVPVKEEGPEIPKGVEIKVEQNGIVVKGENGESVPLVEVMEPDMKGTPKVRKGSKDSESGEEGEGFRCKDCQEGRSQPCFVCHEYVHKKSGEAKLYRCITAYCGKVYHEECLKPWPQTSWRTNGNGKGCERGVLMCPQHTCHTCASDNPGVIKARYSNDKLVRCVRCPTTYHYGNYCLPAGSEILTNSQIICPQHYQPPRRHLTHHVNAAWCFICASGGSLICCDLCPTSFHGDCLNISTPPDGSYVCEDCLTGRFPLYGEIVWVKLGTYRWWPAEILYPALIPDNIVNLPHVRGEFAVRFFGSHDHYWVNRGRVFLYQDGDTAGKGNYKKSSVDHMFERAVREASEAQRKYLEEKATRDAETRPGMKPPNYVKLKTNKPVGNVRTLEMNVSSLTPCECDPKSEAPCAPESDCLNRILMVECNPLVCPAGEKCCNQLFEKRQYPPLQPYQTQARGWGLKTLMALKKGDFVIEYVGEMIDEEEYKKRLSHMHENNEENFYFLTIDKDRMLDAGPKGNVARFMNHSCQPNCETQKWTVNGDTRVGLFAVCDIPANTELVFNYNLESIGSDKKPCMCGAPNCSGFIGVKAIKNQDKEESKEKKVVKKKKVVAVSKTHEEVCFVCGEGGELILCDGKHCTKGYHLSCLSKKQSPQGYWLCPWHQCNVCNKGRVRRCTFCVNSFCQEHSEGNIRLDPVKGLMCTKHDQEAADKQTKDSSQENNPTNKVCAIKTEPTPMEIDGDSSENSTAASNQDSFSSETKIEPINNNVIKPVNTPERRSQRSRSYNGGKLSTDTASAKKRKGRPLSVDDQLIISYEKTEQNNKNKSETESKPNGYKDVEELLDEVVRNLPIDKSIIMEVDNENEFSEDKEVIEVPELYENIKQSTVVSEQQIEKEKAVSNESLEIDETNVANLEKNDGLEEVEKTHSKESQHFERGKDVIDETLKTEETNVNLEKNYGLEEVEKTHSKESQNFECGKDVIDETLKTEETKVGNLEKNYELEEVEKTLSKETQNVECGKDVIDERLKTEETNAANLEEEDVEVKEVEKTLLRESQHFEITEASELKNDLETEEIKDWLCKEINKNFEHSCTESKEVNSVGATELLKMSFEDCPVTKDDEQKIESGSLEIKNYDVLQENNVTQNGDIENDTVSDSYMEIENQEVIEKVLKINNEIKNTANQVDEIDWTGVDLEKSTQEISMTEVEHGKIVEKSSEISEDNSGKSSESVENCKIIKRTDEFPEVLNSEKLGEILENGQSIKNKCDISEDFNSEKFEENDDNKIVEEERKYPTLTDSNSIIDKREEKVNSTVSLDVDDFELSYSECSNDNMFKTVDNSESSLEMKLTDCTSEENDRISETIEEINSKSELASCIEQSNAMQVA